MMVLRRFHGGLRLPRPSGVSIAAASRTPPSPRELVYPLSSHIGTPAEPCVRVGQRVRRGEVIAVPSSYVSQTVHAALGGTVVDIGQRPMIGAQRSQDRCIVIDVDVNAGSAQLMRALNPQSASAEALQARIVDAGIIGMGGAGFPSHVKLREGSAAQHDGEVELLIINGVECEPMIRSDYCLMCERAADVVAGAHVLMRAIGARRCVIAIEADMEQALAAMRQAADETVEVVAVPEIYPAGGEKQLIHMITGEEVPTHGLPVDVGVVMHNAATAVAVGDAVLRGQPLLERMVTVAGAVNEPANLWVPLGTPIEHLLETCSGVVDDAFIVAGGPMMGTRVMDTSAPVVKTTNAVLALTQSRLAPSLPCIRCGECVEVCPVQLQPQALYQFVCAGEWDSAQDYHLFDCIECGACDYVCPSRIPLVSQYRHAKAQIDALDRERARATRLRQRFEAHQQRMASMGTEYEAALEEADSVENDSAAASPRTTDRAAIQEEIAAAIARVKARRDQQALNLPENMDQSSAAESRPQRESDEGE